MELEIIQSPNDKRKYKHLQLKNDLQVLLIQDPETDKSAASLDVYIGQLEDPQENQGIAHFCEHMLFMGTKKYPVQNEYSAFITKNSGSENAFTDLSDTNYYFDIANDAFEQGLDRFAQFFISPLFDETCVDKEINAVESEHQMGLANDDCRNWQLFKHTAKPSSFKQNGGGNLKTLQKPSIRDDLLKFYEKNYSANLMKLVVYSNVDLQQQEKWVSEKFSEIENKNLKRPVYPTIPFDKSNLQKQINIVPIRDEDTLELLWILPSLRNCYKKKIDDFISYLAGFEGKNSLTTFLIDEGLITDLMSYNEHILDSFTVFGIKMTLTQEGLEKYDSVVGFIYKYFEIIREKGIQEWQYQELKQIEKINFQFLEKSVASDYVTQLSQKMQYIPIQDILQFKYQWEDYDPEQIQNILSLLTVDNMQIYLSSHEFEEEDDFTEYETEEHYGTRYKIEDIEEDIVDLCKNPSDLEAENTYKILDITIPNEFIPQKFDLLPNKKENKIPEIVYSSEMGDLWYMKDEKFDISKGWVSFFLFTNDLQLCDQVKGWVQAEMWLHLLENYMQEMIDMADQTEMKAEIKLLAGGFKFKIKGYDDSLFKFIHSIISKIATFDVERDGGERIFNILYEKCETEYLNHFKDQPDELADEYICDIIQVDGRYTMEEKLKTLRELKYEDFQKNIQQGWLKSFFIEWYFYGNLEKTNSVEFIKEIEKLLKPQDFTPYEKQNIHPIRACVQNSQEILLFEKSLDDEEVGNQEEPNSAIQMTFQGQNETQDYRLKLKVLKNYLAEPFFDQLRTNEQLGYSVYCFEQYIRGMCGVSFVIQSSVADPNKLSQRILAFIDSYREKIKNITDEEFNEIKQSVLVKETEKEDNMYKEALHYYQEIYFHAYVFDRKEKVKELIDQISKEEFIGLFEEIFYKENQRVEAHIISKEHIEQQKESFEKRSDKGLVKVIENITEHQQRQKETGNMHRDYYGPQNTYQIKEQK